MADQGYDMSMDLEGLKVYQVKWLGRVTNLVDQRVWQIEGSSRSNGVAGLRVYQVEG